MPVSWDAAGEQGRLSQALLRHEDIPTAQEIQCDYENQQEGSSQAAHASTFTSSKEARALPPPRERTGRGQVGGTPVQRGRGDPKGGRHTPPLLPPTPRPLTQSFSVGKSSPFQRCKDTRTQQSTRCFSKPRRTEVEPPPPQASQGGLRSLRLMGTET